jgi:hypothetical protein
VLYKHPLAAGVVAVDNLMPMLERSLIELVWLVAKRCALPLGGSAR